MTDHEAAKALDGLADWWSHPKLDKVNAHACRRGAAALRQPRLPDRWPLVWEKDAVGWYASGPLGCFVRVEREGAWRLRLRDGVVVDRGHCTRPQDARRAAERAVARAVKESLKGGAK